jgi:sugar transferase EpsL
MSYFLNLAFALVIFLIISPISASIFIYLSIFIGNPIIFKQKRSGLNGRKFNLYKFRTMTISKKKKEIKRILKSTVFLRISRLDELPQLINIIKGDLNFIGPRPLLPEYDKLYTKEQKKRLSIKPGITGWAQVNGDNNISWKKKFQLDLWYVKNRTILLDLKIIFLTFLFFVKIGLKKNNNKLITKKFNGKN